MNSQEYEQLYTDLCKVIDDDLFLASMHGFQTPTTRARRSVDKLLKVLAQHGIVIESEPHEQSNPNN